MSFDATYRRLNVEHVQEARPNSVLAQMLTVSQAAQFLGLTVNVLRWRLQRQTGPKSYKFQGRLLFKREDLAAYKETLA